MKQPTLEQWRLFVQIADLGSITDAAAARDVAQPALSRQLAAIERSCGGRLFEREARGMRLNQVGQRLYPRVVEWLAHAEDLVACARGDVRTPHGLVRLGVLESMAPELVGHVFRKVRTQFPGITLRVTVGLSGALDDAVQSGGVDLALLSTNSRERHKQEIPIGKLAHCLVGPPGNVLTQANTVAFAELDGLPLVVPGRPYAFHSLLEHWAARRGITLNVVAECDSLPLQKQLVATGGIYAIMATCAVQDDLANGRLQAARVVSPELNRNIVLRTTSAHAPTPASKEVLRIVERIAVSELEQGRYRWQMP